MRNSKIIQITIQNHQYDFHYGITLEEILLTLPPKTYPVVAAYVNGYLQELSYMLIADSEIRWIDISENIGMRIYRQSQRLLLLSAHNNVLPHRQLHIKHSLENGTFCQSRGENPLTEKELSLLEDEMHRLIRSETPIRKVTIFSEDAKAYYHQRCEHQEAELLEASGKSTVDFYEIDKTVEAFQGNLVSNCRFISQFDLAAFEDGFILRAPNLKEPMAPFSGKSNIGSLMNQCDRLVESLEISRVSELNRAIDQGKVGQIIEMAEMMQTQQLFHIGQTIIDDVANTRLVLIAGPSSSGKTTFSHRLSVFFRINGVEPVTIAMDDYFVDRGYTPVDENGNYDFESINALDLERFDNDLYHLINGEAVETPIFDFHEGVRSKETRRMQMNDQQILIIEGIHGLNERIAQSVPKANKRRIYISALTQINIDRYNPISSTDNRLIRRMTRDMQFRSTSPAETIERWESVRTGEEKNIFPYQENADFFFNTALIYELAVLKPLIEPELKKITTSNRSYNEARRILSILEYFKPIDASMVAPGSLLKEFIGGSPFAEA